MGGCLTGMELLEKRGVQIAEVLFQREIICIEEEEQRNWTGGNPDVFWMCFVRNDHDYRRGDSDAPCLTA